MYTQVCHIGKKIKIKNNSKQMDRYAFTEGTVSLDTIRRELIFSCCSRFPARAYNCAILVIREYKKKKRQ